MKKRIILILALIAAIYAGACIKADTEIRRAVLSRGIPVEFKFAILTGPYTVTMFGVESGNMNAFSVAVNLNLLGLMFGNKDRSIDGVSIYGMEMIFADADTAAGASNKQPGAPFILPFMKSMSVENGSIIYYNSKSGNDFRITGITMRSKYSGTGRESERMVQVNGYGYLMGKKSAKLHLKLDYYPYFKNRFLFSVFGANIDSSVFGPVFEGSNVVIERGTVNFVTQLKGESRVLYLNNIMQFKGISIKEKEAGIREFLGLSYGDIVRFNTDTKGDFDLGFSFSMPDSEFTALFNRYGEEFARAVKNKVMMGVLAAPFRKAGEMLWDITGGGVKKIFDMMTGNGKKQEDIK